MSVTNFTGEQIYAMMQDIRIKKDNISKYFYFDSELWRAIRAHIASDDCVLITPDKEGVVAYARGVGPLIQLREWHAFGDQYKTGKPVAPDVFQIQFVVEYCNSDHEREWKQAFYLEVPLDLLTNFTKSSFDKWISKIRAAKKEIDEKADLEVLRKLVKKYPSTTRAFLNKKTRKSK